MGAPRVSAPFPRTWLPRGQEVLVFAFLTCPFPQGNLEGADSEYCGKFAGLQVLNSSLSLFTVSFCAVSWGSALPYCITLPVGSGNLNSGPSRWEASTLLTEPLPQPTLYF